MSFKTPILCDRRVYDKRAKWKNPNNDIEETLYYFVKEPLSLVSSYENGREQMKETITITIFGGKPIAKEDTIILEDGSKFVVESYVVNYIESNIMIKDMLKPRVASMTLVLA